MSEMNLRGALEFFNVTEISSPCRTVVFGTDLSSIVVLKYEPSSAGILLNVQQFSGLHLAHLPEKNEVNLLMPGKAKPL